MLMPHLEPGCFETGIAYDFSSSNNNLTEDYVDSHFHCQLRCQERAGCKYWKMQSDTGKQRCNTSCRFTKLLILGKCSLAFQFNGKQYDENFISGPAECTSKELDYEISLVLKDCT